MKFSKNNLLKLKNKNKNLKFKTYKKVKRNSLRGRIKGTPERPRLVIFRSNEHIYAQIIDDLNSRTLLSCSTLDREIQFDCNNGKNCYGSKILGMKLANKSLKKNITKIVFDRNRYLYHGRIKSVAEGARSEGLNF